MYGRITLAKILVILLSGVAITLLANLCYLPGPDFLFYFGEFTYLAMTFVSLYAILFSPAGLVWFVVSTISHRRIMIKPLLAVLIPVFCYFNLITINEYLRRSARNFAILEAGELISSIEQYNNDKGLYPVNLQMLVPDYINELRESNIIGIRDFWYVVTDDTYELQFSQNGYSSFNPTIVIYNPLGQQKADGDMPILYETGAVNWKYYIFD
jgi:hypothetical protein